TSFSDLDFNVVDGSCLVFFVHVIPLFAQGLTLLDTSSSQGLRVSYDYLLQFGLVRTKRFTGQLHCLRYDNAAVETFFKTIKAELIWRHPWETSRKAEMAIFEYINGFHNPRRRHSALGWKSPVAFERMVA
ncbi:MAG: IS3 family transposase, partial [Mangrovicoccus sp.]